MTYRAPVRDLAFALETQAGLPGLMASGAFPDLDADTVTAVLEAAASFAETELAPLNRSGDLEGARYENGRVTAPKGFAEAYRSFVESGWNGVSASPDHGGMGLPKALECAVFEMVEAANMAFGLAPMLTQGAIEALASHGTERQKALYLPKLVSGEWTGTMNLTEPQAGSDLAALTTRADPDGEGGYRLYGQKIFITWGDHDIAENIVHLVLARLPDAPAGTKGISLFVAPKRLVAEEGSLGGPNDLRPGSIEHKLGIHGSPTCVMLFEGARAELVGELNQGLAHMFVMMNSARLHVGVQGAAIAERAYQQALAFSLERRQSRSVWTGDYPARLFDLPDVRRTLALMKAKTEAARAICLSVGVLADLARVTGSDTARARQELLTPIAKAWSTDVGVEVASLGVQVHGGMGFIEETGAAQHYRDARIAPIYEGTNGIQAIDLIGRKLAGDGGAAAHALIAEIRETAAGIDGPLGVRLTEGAVALGEATDWQLRNRGPDGLAAASPYLTLFGDVVGGWMLAKGAAAAADRGDDPWMRGKADLANLYAGQVLATAPGRAAGLMDGAAAIADLSPEAIGA